MRVIDQYAYSNRLARVHPASKAGLALWVIVLCLMLDRPLVGVLALCWMAVLVVGLAGLPSQVFGRLLLTEGVFLLFTSIGVAISFSFTPSQQIWQRPFGPLWLSTSPEALQEMLRLITRTLGAVSALNFFALTTPLVDVVHLLRQLRLPEALIDVMVIMYRFIFVLLDTLERMRTAQKSRLGYQVGYWQSMKHTGQLGAQLFLHTLMRIKRLETAVANRNFDGTFRVVTPRYQPFPNYPLWLIGITMVLVGARFI